MSSPPSAWCAFSRTCAKSSCCFSAGTEPPATTSKYLRVTISAIPCSWAPCSQSDFCLVSVAWSVPVRSQKGSWVLFSGRLGILGYAAIERMFREPLDIDATLGSDGGGCTQFDTDVHEGPSLVLEDWGRKMATCRGWWASLQAMRCGPLQVVQSNLWISAPTHFVTPRFGTEFHFRSELSAVGLRGHSRQSVRGVVSPDELEEAIQLAAAQAVDSDVGAWVTIPQRRSNSKTTVQVLRRTSLKVTNRGEVGGHVWRRTWCGQWVSPLLWMWMTPESSPSKKR